MTELSRIPLAGVIGAPVAHSRSPRLHGYWLKKYGIAGHYVPLEVSPEDLEQVIRALPKAGFVGCNVTIPHKEAVLSLADIVTDRAALIGVLGREPDPAELYLAHFLGAAGAGKFLSALATDPGQSAASLLPQAAAANRSVFFGANGAPRSLGQVMDLLRTRMTAAMGDAGSEFPFASPIKSGWERGSQALGISPLPRIPGSEGISSPPRPSMAETLAAAFGGGGEAAMPGHVRAAYGRLKGLGL